MAFLTGRIPYRAVIWFMVFTVTWFCYMLRINISIIILAMVEPAKNADNTVATPECLVINSNNTNYTNSSSQEVTAVPNYGPRYDWDSKLQGNILAAYFYGFITTSIPGGYITERFGPRKCVTISFTIAALLTILTPWLASVHSTWLIVARVFTGAVGGVAYPAAHYMIAKYSPPEEKGTFVSALLGNNFGTMVTWPVLGYVIESIGWDWAFYICGIVVLVWTALFYILVYDSPEEHPYISDEEKKYITESMAQCSLGKIKRVPPYKQMALSIPFLALIILQFGNLWGLFFLLTAGPNFMSTVLGFNLGHTGILASLPYLARFAFGIAIFGHVGDYIFKKGWMSRSAIVKFFVIFSHILPGVLLLAQTFMGCNVTWAIVLITLSLGMNGASCLTSLHNPHDLSPNFAPTVYGIANCIASTTGFINPLIVGYMTAEHNGMAEWHIIFYIGSSVYIACGLIFCIFGSGEIQPWNEVTGTDSTTNPVESLDQVLDDAFKNDLSDNIKDGLKNGAYKQKGEAAF